MRKEWEREREIKKREIKVVLSCYNVLCTSLIHSHSKISLADSQNAFYSAQTCLRPSGCIQNCMKGKIVEKVFRWIKLQELSSRLHSPNFVRPPPICSFSWLESISHGEGQGKMSLLWEETTPLCTQTYYLPMDLAGAV